MRYFVTTNLNESFNQKMWLMGSKHDSHETDLQDFHMKISVTLHNLGYFKGSLMNPLGVMDKTSTHMLKYKDIKAVKNALNPRTANEKAHKYRHRSRNNAPAYCAGQGDVMPDPVLSAPSADLPDFAVPSTSGLN